MVEPGGGRARQSSPPVGRLEEPRPRSAPPQPRFEGQLNKFTNVVKGWQYRWFVLSPESGRLEYYLLEVSQQGDSGLILSPIRSPRFIGYVVY